MPSAGALKRTYAIAAILKGSRLILGCVPRKRGRKHQTSSPEHGARPKKSRQRRTCKGPHIGKVGSLLEVLVFYGSCRSGAPASLGYFSCAAWHGVGLLLLLLLLLLLFLLLLLLRLVLLLLLLPPPLLLLILFLFYFYFYVYVFFSLSFSCYFYFQFCFYCYFYFYFYCYFYF